jgi:hypothetical protein
VTYSFVLGFLLALAAPPTAAQASATGPASVTGAASARPGGVAPGSPVTVTAKAGKSEVTVGESLTIELAASGPPGTTFTFAPEASAEEFELRTAPAAADAPTPAGSHRYDARIFALGELSIPGLPVRYRLADGTAGEAVSQPIAIKVGSLLPKSQDEQKLADIRGPAAVGIGRAFWVAAAVLVLALAALLGLWLRRRRRPDTPAPVHVPDLPPDAEALAALDALARDGLPARGELRGFYIRLSVILKRYLERRLGAPVLEMTSAETLSFLRAHDAASDWLPVVRDVAEAGDRIKFARGEGLVAEGERHLASVRELVAALEARLRPRPAEPPAAGKAA